MYGQHWEIGDTISVMLDLDHAEMSFARNGEFMGIAFADFDCELSWYD